MKLAAALAVTLLAPAAFATNITLMAVLGNKAILNIDGAQRTVSVGQSIGSIKLLALNSDAATIDAGGAQKRLVLGEGYTVSGGRDTSGGSLTLTADRGGHFYTDLRINGIAQKAVVDTGASFISLSSSVADKMKIDYRKGREGMASTANGKISVWITKVPQVQIGNVMLYDVDVSVQNGDTLDIALLGNSALNRFQMKRDNDLLTLTKKTY
ncbi:retropepsin-like aspartic protease family protein [Jeongeupia naejangsanensis]|uniref:TIGR02281 family clan AA aspartic protease n=1 Tax=Jeongeupia naejangsanensis TaxID=613195 RepID=A0ABS2BNV4_9NEIS|nr:TIGR02281 family clan AA aspartic protease [Jeongeupia naejangsanensis]MBM3117299.1 TIGR02281 family clan AA aspartic protease [Jeongeupia naejangsanensis]